MIFVILISNNRVHLCILMLCILQIIIICMCNVNKYIQEAIRRVGAAAEAAENRKHTANDPKCAELGWRCVPLHVAVEAYCNWGGRQERPLLYTGHMLGLWLFLIS